MKRRVKLPGEKVLYFSCCLFLGILLMVVMPVSALAANQVDLQVSGMVNDTISPVYPATFDFWIENDIILGGISLGFQVWSPDGATWQWQAECTHGMNPSFVCVVPGSRADGFVWDFISFIVLEQNVDGMDRDTFLLSGVAMLNGLQPGPLEHMYSAHFMAEPAGGPGDVETLCIDSAFVPPSGTFVFADLGGNAFVPTVLWDYGSKCYPVAYAHACHAEWEYSNPTSMTIEHCASGQVTLEATQPEMEPLHFDIESVIGGAGTASVTQNSDYSCIVTYAPVLEDIEQTIQITVVVSCGDGNIEMPWDLQVSVTYDSPLLDIGSYYNWGATNNLLIKDDITVADGDACDDPEFLIISGPGEIDPSTGVYTHMPGPDDSGVFYATIAVTDGVDTSQGEIYIGITGEDCCPGDVNYTGDVNVGDAVSLINYIFKGGIAPKVMNWADPNADCQVNVGDVVFLISYVFRGGAAPVVGCYY